jgi:hypothetical protein
MRRFAASSLDLVPLQELLADHHALDLPSEQPGHPGLEVGARPRAGPALLAVAQGQLKGALGDAAAAADLERSIICTKPWPIPASSPPSTRSGGQR